MNWDGINRRKFVRVKFPCIITTYTPKTHTISAHTQNISTGGLRVIIEERLKASSTIDLTIYDINQKTINCKGIIRWVFTRKVPHINDLPFFDTGIEFTEIKDEYILEIENFISSADSSDSKTKEEETSLAFDFDTNSQ